MRWKMAGSSPGPEPCLWLAKGRAGSWVLTLTSGTLFLSLPSGQCGLGHVTKALARALWGRVLRWWDRPSLPVSEARDSVRMLA